jgi:hypothetical protein
MKIEFKKIVAITLICLMFVIITTASNSLAAIEKNRERLTEFLSSVIGLDLTEYTLSNPVVSNSSKIAENPQEPDNLSYSLFGPNVKVEGSTLNYTSRSGNLEIHGYFYNERMQGVLIYPRPLVNIQDVYIYSEKAPIDTTDQANSILEKYRIFASQSYSADSSYLVSMKNILQTASDSGLLLQNETSGNMNFVVEQNGGKTDLQWICIHDGVSMGAWKRVWMSFSNNSLVGFMDTWGLYQLGESNVISSDQALKTALTAAQNYKIKVGYENGTNETLSVPNLSGTHHFDSFAYLPYSFAEETLASNTSRAPLTLYPIWRIQFSFPNGTIGGLDGVDVGVLGDTGEVSYVTGIGYYGSHDELFLPSGQQLNTDSLTLTSVVVVATILVMVTSAVVLTQRKKRRN